MRKDRCRSLPVHRKSSLPVNYYTVKKVGGGGSKGSFLVSTGTNYASGTFIWFFFPHNQDSEVGLFFFK